MFEILSIFQNSIYKTLLGLVYLDLNLYGIIFICHLCVFQLKFLSWIETRLLKRKWDLRLLNKSGRYCSNPLFSPFPVLFTQKPFNNIDCDYE